MIWFKSQDYLCACFEINLSERQQGSAMSSIICDCWCHLKIVAFECCHLRGKKYWPESRQIDNSRMEHYC